MRKLELIAEDAAVMDLREEVLSPNFLPVLAGAAGRAAMYGVGATALMAHACYGFLFITALDVFVLHGIDACDSQGRIVSLPVLTQRPGTPRGVLCPHACPNHLKMR